MPTKQTDSGAAAGYQSEPWAMGDRFCGLIAESFLLVAAGGRLDAPESDT